MLLRQSLYQFLIQFCFPVTKNRSKFFLIIVASIEEDMAALFCKQSFRYAVS